MRRFPLPAFVSVALSLLASMTACKAPSQMVLGFATDLSAPGVLDRVELRVRDTAGVQLLAEDWDLPGLLSRDFSLPGSFSLYAADGAEPTVRVELVGKHRAQKVGEDDVVVVSRTSSLLFSSEATLFFRMALVERCMGMSCGAGSTCIEGKCRPEGVNTVSLLAYERGMEAKLACISGSHFIDTASKQPMETAGSGYCSSDEWCGESTCYRNQGQGLLWCSPAGSTCKGIDGYEGCLVAACNAQLTACYGPAWRRGRYTGVCRDEASCRSACNCEAGCLSRCEQARSAECASCRASVESCVLGAEQTTCTEPTCTPIPVASDMGVPLADVIAIPPGTYYMGCSPADPKHPDPECNSDAQPLHAVQLSSFRIDRLEVTQQQYAECLRVDACKIAPAFAYTPDTTGSSPVVAVDWTSAQAYCAYAGRRLGAQLGRLPTEAEWETAAHGTPSMNGAGSTYPFGDAPPSADCTQAVTSLCSPPGVRPVGGRPAGASPFGVEDLAGNVFEWVGDWYGPMTYLDQLRVGTSPNPMGPASGMERVKRGGDAAQPSNGSTLHDVSASARYSASIDTVSDGIGFRCVYIP